MLIIRLQRIGKKKAPSYRLVINEKTRDTQGRSLEILGQYSPVEKEKIINLKEDRIKHWLSVGAQCSETVNNLLIQAGIIEGKKQKSVYISKKRKAKLDDKKAEAEDKKKEAEEATKAEAAKAEEVVKEKAPAEEPKKEEKKVEEKVEPTPAPEESKPEEKKEEASVEEDKKEEKTE